MKVSPSNSGRRHEATILDTAITIEPLQLARLELKLHEYRVRHADQPKIDALDEGSLAVHGFSTLHELFKRMVLEIVIELAQTEKRDTHTKPITMPEVAWYFGQQAGVNVSGAVFGPEAIPWRYDEGRDWHIPAFEVAPNQPRGLGELFVGAYGVIRAYAHDRQDTLGGGSGLAVIPRPAAYFGNDPEW